MTATVHPPPVPPQSKARVLRLIPTIRKPLDTNCTDVTVKLKRALRTAQSGATTGALVIALSKNSAPKGQDAAYDLNPYCDVYVLLDVIDAFA